MIAIDESIFLNGLRQNDYQILDEIYKTYLPKITAMVIQNKGTRDDARDVFQEGLVILFNKLNTPDFELTTGFAAYFYGTCRFIWLRQLKKKYRKEVTLEDDERLIAEASIEKDLIESEQRKFYKQKFAELTEECQSVLQSFFNGKPLKEIAQKMGYTTEYVKRKKYKCKERLAQLIKGDKRFSEFV